MKSNNKKRIQISNQKFNGIDIGQIKNKSNSNVKFQNNYVQEDKAQVQSSKIQSASVMLLSQTKTIQESNKKQQPQNMESIISSQNQAKCHPEDERQYVEDISKYPYNCVGKIIANFTSQSKDIVNQKKIIKKSQFTGMGGIISQNVIITTAHVVYDKKNEIMAQKIEFYIENQDKYGKKTFTKIKVEKTCVHPLYITAPQTSQEFKNHDIAILILEKNNIIKPNQVLNIKWNYSFDIYLDRNIMVIGYKTDALGQSKLAKTQQKAFCQQNCILKYKHTTDGGYSGSPILLQQFNAKNQPSYSLIGIHKGYSTKCNYCILLSKVTNPHQSFNQFIQSLGLQNEFKQNYLKSKSCLIEQNKKLNQQIQKLTKQNETLNLKNNRLTKQIEQKTKQIPIVKKNVNTNRSIVNFQKQIKQFEQNQTQNKQKILAHQNILIEQLKGQIQSLKRLNSNSNLNDNNKYKNKSQGFSKKISSPVYDQKVQKINQKQESSFSNLHQNQMNREPQIEQTQSKNYKQEIQNQQNASQIIENHIKRDRGCVQKLLSFFFPDNESIKKEEQIPSNKQQYIKHLIKTNEYPKYTNKQLSSEYNKKVTKKPDNKYRLKLYNYKFKMKEFVTYDWKDFSIIQLIACEIDDNEWNIFVNNLNAFPHLKYLKVTQNKITRVTKNQLQRFKYFQQLWFRNGSNGTNRLSSASVKNLDNFGKMYKYVELCYK